jgi:polar amino acid transport system ATP-binding protein
MEEIIRVENLHKSFHSLHVLKGINLVVKKGEIVSVIGPQDQGKALCSAV